MRDATRTVVDESGGAKPKAEWDALANDDYVSVCWKFTDNPRKAYKVTVKPAPKDDAKDDAKEE